MAILDYLIPGYKGYRLRQESRETDKLFRDYVSKLLAENHQQLEDIKVQLTSGGNLAALNPADQCTKVLTKLRDRLRFSNYGFSALFARDKVDNQRLEQVEQFDKTLVEQREQIKGQIGQIQAVLDEGGQVAAEFRKLTNLLREMDRHLNQREQLIRGQEGSEQ
ncbi:MAG: hypothetical protein J7M25_11550 [Deltaproteobacteria bacterium]|nr:hypothetical protein [Deltaproteobacteria bacterium]